MQTLRSTPPDPSVLEVSSIESSENSLHSYAALAFVTVTNYTGRCPVGKLYSLYYQKEFEFHGFDQMILILDDIMDTANFPQAYDACRSLKRSVGRPSHRPSLRYFFCPLPDTPKTISTTSYNAIHLPEISSNTFQLQIYYRQNATMQGCLTTKTCQAKFRSSMELVRILYEYLDRAYPDDEE